MLQSRRGASQQPMGAIRLLHGLHETAGLGPVNIRLARSGARSGVHVCREAENVRPTWANISAMRLSVERMVQRSVKAVVHDTKSV
jgi:hypothetical protein